MRSPFNNFAASWGGKKEPNTFIGNVADLIPDKSTLTGFLSGVNSSDIQSFETLGNNIKFYIDVNYTPQFFGSLPMEEMTYFIDLDGKVNGSSGNWRVSQETKYSLQFLYLPKATSVPVDAFRTTRGKAILALPNVLDLGGTPLNNSVFRGDGGSIPAHRLTIDQSQETINSGSPDLDITGSGFRDSLLENGGTVTYVTDKTNPNAITDLSVIDIGGTYAELSFTQPTHVNTLKYALVFVNGFFNSIVDINTTPFNVGGLDENNANTIKIIIADEYFNISDYSNTVNVTTTTNPAIYQNAVVYYKLDETSGQPIDVVNGFNGTLFGVVTQGVTGKIGTAYSFDGVSGYVRSSPLGIYQNYSFNCYCSADDWSTTDRREILTLPDDVDGTPINFGIQNGKIGMWRGSAAGNVTLSYDVSGLTGFHSLGYSEERLSSNNKEVKIYLDGVNVVTINGDWEDIDFSKGNYTIGGFSNFWKGKIDEHFITSEILTSFDFSDLDNNGNGTTI